MFQHIITSILAFASTNIDDIFILILFFSAKNHNSAKIISGQYIGVLTLALISFVGSVIGNFVDQRYVGILGLFPIFLAIKHLYSHFKKTREDANSVDSSSADTNPPGMLAVAGVTIANGADNIGVYTPLMTTMSGVEKALMITVFLVMIYLWCIAARYLASHPLIAKQLDRFSHIITPLVLFCLGIFILFESGTFSLFF